MTAIKRGAVLYARHDSSPTRPLYHVTSVDSQSPRQYTVKDQTHTQTETYTVKALAQAFTPAGWQWPPTLPPAEPLLPTSFVPATRVIRGP